MIIIPLPLIISVQGFQGFLPSSYLTQGHPNIDRRIRPLVTLGISLVSSVVVAQIWQTLGRIRTAIAVSLSGKEFQKAYGGLENRYGGNIIEGSNPSLSVQNPVPERILAFGKVHPNLAGGH